MPGKAARRSTVAVLVTLWAALAYACAGEDAPRRAEETGTPATTTEPSAAARTATSPNTGGSRDPERESIEADLALVGGTVLDGTGRPPVEDAVVAVRSGRIVAVGRSGEVELADATPTIDVSGSTVLPGFVNAHAHTRYVSSQGTAAWTRAGVTTVRDLGGFLEDAVARKRASEGEPRLPRLLVAGPMMTVPGGYPIPIYGEDYPVLTVDGPEDARAQANRLLDAGVDHLKIAVSGRADTGWPELSDAEIRAITGAAHDRGSRVSVHVDTAAGLRRAVQNGADDAAHSPRDRIPDDLIDLMVERDVAMIPTIDVYQNIAEQSGTAAEWNAATLPVMYDNLRRFEGAGGTLALGDDFGNPGVELGMPLEEMEHWVAAGLDPARVIEAATRGGATVSGLEDEIGTLEKGKAADLFVVSGDPLADLDALGRVALVVRDGRVVFRP